MRTEPELLNERLDRLALVLDEIMPNCANLVRDALDLLKEQEEEIENLKQTAQSMMEGICLLKEQDAELSFREAKAITHTATKLDDATCPSCGNVVGEKQIWEGRKIFIQWKYCVFCGQKLDWEGR